MLKGDATRNLTLMFLENWHAAMGTSEDYGAFLKPAVSYKATDKGYVAPYGDSPFDHENVGEQVYVHILERAKNYVHIMTPYLILDETMLNHLTFAAKRGVEVIIIMSIFTALSREASMSRAMKLPAFSRFWTVCGGQSTATSRWSRRN